METETVMTAAVVTELDEQSTADAEVATATANALMESIMQRNYEIEWARIINTYVRSSASLEVNLESSVRNAVLAAQSTEEIAAASQKLIQAVLLNLMDTFKRMMSFSAIAQNYFKE